MVGSQGFNHGLPFHAACSPGLSDAEALPKVLFYPCLETLQLPLHAGPC